MSKKEKAVQLSQSAWSKTKTAVARTKQKAMVAMGKADQTVDISFNQQKEIFNEHYEAIKKLNKDATKVLDILKDLSLAIRHWLMTSLWYSMEMAMVPITRKRPRR